MNRTTLATLNEKHEGKTNFWILFHAWCLLKMMRPMRQDLQFEENTTELKSDIWMCSLFELSSNAKMLFFCDSFLLFHLVFISRSWTRIKYWIPSCSLSKWKHQADIMRNESSENTKRMKRRGKSIRWNIAWLKIYKNMMFFATFLCIQS